MLPSPSDLLGISGFESWRAGQYDAFNRLIAWYHSSQRFLGTAMPTGTGKSLQAMLLAKLSGARTVILTATKGLQQQFKTDFGNLVAIVQGQQNFTCALVPSLRADDGPCHEGASCNLKSTDCRYHQQLNAALRARIVVTNYAYYLAQTNFTERGLGEVDLLICDEGHLAFASMESHLTIHLSRLDIEPLGLSFPVAASEWQAWQAWAEVCEPIVKEAVSELEANLRDARNAGRPASPATARQYRVVKSVLARLGNLAGVREDWVIQETRHGYRFTPKWVANHAMRLFGTVPKVMVMSAILSHKTLDYLGVPADEERRAWLEVNSTFPARNTPIVHVPTVRVNHRTDDYGAVMWASRIDQIIRRRLDRKGIIFTVSYERARMLLQRSEHKDIMMTHATHDVVDVVRRFKQARAPMVLVSPTVTTGWDFPGDFCRYIIIGKIPWPDSRDPVTKSRHEEDKDWTSFLAMDSLIQSAGRGTRSEDDKTEVLIVDDMWVWFYPKYKNFAPGWFRARYRGSVSSVPEPMV
ncbi:MAG: DEAD/DEAH box helicase family protein [Nitrososphaerota archaeon]|nr:DEAD/DEAH box helicase family protein [Nitrososphaerota archaeon]